MTRIRLIYLGAFLSFVAGDAPLLSRPYPAPVPVYGPPRIELPYPPPPPPAPVPVYGPPRTELPPTPPTPVPVYGPPRNERPYSPPPPPAPVPVYGPPRTELPPNPPAPVPVYGPPRTERPYPPPPPPAPVPVYGPPRTELPPTPPAPVPVYGPPRIERPYPSPPPPAPVPVYGPPRTERPYPPPPPPSPVYGPPRTELPPSPPAPVPVYGPPRIERPYPSPPPPSPVYGPPRTELPPSPPAPVPVYGPPRTERPYPPPPPPSPVYGPPRTELPPSPPAPVPVYGPPRTERPYPPPPPPSPVYGPPRTELPPSPPAPEPVYGPPRTERPYPPPPPPSPVYGPPRTELPPSPPAPVPVYGPPRTERPYPPPPPPSPVYGPPRTELPPSPPAPEPVYGPPRTERPYPPPPPPSPVYGPPRTELPPSPPAPEPVYGPPRTERPYPPPPPPSPVYGPPRTELPPSPPAPVPVYGPPRTEQPYPPPPPPSTVYGPPRTELPPTPPAPVPVYGPPRIERPYSPPPPPAPLPVYGLPRIEVPAPVYGVPKIQLPNPQIVTEYGYKLYTPAKRVEVIVPQPAPVYGLPKTEISRPVVPITSSYKYDVPAYIPKVMKTYAAPVPVFNFPKLDLPIFPTPVYGVPKIEVPEPPQLEYGLPRLPRNSRAQWHCNVCGVQFRSIEGVLDSERVATCVKCGGKICRVRCSSRDLQVGWVCRSCQHPESWFKGILKALHPNSIVRTSKTKMDPNRIDEIDEDLEVLKKKEKEQVRDFIERLVEAMLGGSIDSTSISRIYNDKQYDIIISRYHMDLSSTLTDLGSALHMSIANLPIVGQSPCSAHASLKLLIQRVIQEAIGLPPLRKAQEHPGAPVEDVSRTYEDLLATAILNKVIQNYQEELPTSSANSVSSRLSNSSRQNDKEYFFGEETLDSKWKNGNSTAADIDTTSVSSLDEWVRSDSSVGSAKFVDHMTLTIQQRIEEVSSSDDEAVVKPVHRNTLAPDSDEWQNNWVMQKRKFGGSVSPVPVPMLVPNPTSEAKVLIGDRDAEDTTDLSDAASDYGDSESVQGIESILVDSKTVIGGKNLLADVNVEDEVVSEDGTTDASDMVQEKERVMEQFASNGHDAFDMIISETINSAIVDQAGSSEDNSPTSLDSHTEQDTEYTEKYATLPRTILKSPTPMTRDLKSVTESFANQKVEQALPQQEENNAEVVDDGVPKQNGHHEPLVSIDGEDEKQEKFKGSYSEREKEKWKNAVEMKNNPYSLENLNRRLSNQSSNSSTSSMFGRDYYIREAAKSAGARKNTASNEDDVDETTKSEEVIKEPATELPPVPSPESAYVFKAVPAVIETDSPQQTDNESSIEVASPIPPNLLELSTDSDLSVERVYNLHSGKVYEKVGDRHREINRTTSPEIIKYAPTNTEFDTNKFAVDENHNTTTNDRKRDFLRSLTHTDDTDIYSPVSTPTNDDVFAGKIIAVDNNINNVSDEIAENNLVSTPTNDDVFAEKIIAVDNNINNVSDEIAGNNLVSTPTDDEVFAEKVIAVDNNINNMQFISNDIDDNKLVCQKPEVQETVPNLNTSTDNLSSFDNTDTSIQEFSLEFSTDGQEDSISSPSSSLNVTADPEIVDLKDKHLVKDRLGQFSKSYPNLASVPLRKVSGNTDSPLKNGLDVPEQTSPRLVRMLDMSVHDLRLQFDKHSDSSSSKEDLSKKPVYSLTARSIPREFRQELKEKENITEPELQKAILTSEENKQSEEPKIFPDAKSRIKFFENLKK